MVTAEQRIQTALLRGLPNQTTVNWTRLVFLDYGISGASLPTRSGEVNFRLRFVSQATVTQPVGADGVQPPPEIINFQVATAVGSFVNPNVAGAGNIRE